MVAFTEANTPTPGALTPEFAAAFVAACGELVDVDKGKTADAGNYRYRYADLAAVLADVRPVLARHGLAVVQDVATEGVDSAVAVLVSTVVVHTSSGVYRSPVLRLTAPPDPQRVGSAITYARRYSLMATLGIAATEDDDDAASARAAPPPQPPPRPRLPAPRSQAEQHIRKLLTDADPELRRRVIAAFEARENFGMTLLELPTDMHDAALNFVNNRLDPGHPDNLDAADRADADAAHEAAEQPDEPPAVTPERHTQP